MLNSLRFGSLETPRVRYLVAGVVKGIGDYGNCMGVPTVGGEVMFDAAYEGNPLVNAMCVGIMKEEELIRAKAEGIGQPGDRRRRAYTGATAFTAPRSPPKISPTRTKPSVRACRWAIRSPRSCSSKPRSS
jgi:hypothetical protein